jgi:hypothetical protein
MCALTSRSWHGGARSDTLGPMRATFMIVVAVLVVIVGLVAAPPSAAAQPPGEEKGTFGIGLILGEPTGISAKLYLKDDEAIQGAIGGAFVGGGLQVHADYVFHPWILEDRESFTMPVYVGPGARVIDYNSGRGGSSYVAIGARAVAGLLFDFKDTPLDVFVEVAGVFEYGFSSTDGGFGLAINGGAGARYYF